MSKAAAVEVSNDKNLENTVDGKPNTPKTYQQYHTHPCKSQCRDCRIHKAHQKLEGKDYWHEESIEASQTKVGVHFYVAKA